MIGTLPNHTKKNWQKLVSTLVSAYNSTASNATCFSLYFLLYSCQPHLPIDIEFGMTQANISGPTHENYAWKLKARLRWANKITMEISCCMVLVPGDIVLVRIKLFGQDHKNADKQEQNPHIALSQMGNQPVFKGQSKNGRDQEGIWILHWNMLYPIQSAQNSAQDTTDQIPVKSVMALAKANLLMDLNFADV